MKKALRWLAAMAMTWFLATTILAALVTRAGVASFTFAVLLNLLLMWWIVMVFAIIDPNLDHPWLTPYFRTRGWEQDGRRYLPLGVLGFQVFLKKSRMGAFHDFRVTHDAVSLARMERETRNAELAHGVCFLVVVGFAVYPAMMVGFSGGLWLLVIGVVCQVYPMLLQRYHRPRWRRALTRARDRSSWTLPASIRSR